MQLSSKETFDLVTSLAPAARTATANGTGVDLANFNAANVLIIGGTWTDGTHTLKLQDSDDNSAFTDVVAANLDGSFTAITSAPTAALLQRIGYLGSRRYIRVVTTVAGATTGAIYAGTVMRGAPRKMPK